MRSRGTAVAAPDADAVGAAPTRAPPDEITARMSFLLMRPPAPVPLSCARSTLFSRARRRTNGELWMRRPLPGADTCGGTGDVAVLASSTDELEGADVDAGALPLSGGASATGLSPGAAVAVAGTADPFGALPFAAGASAGGLLAGGAAGVASAAPAASITATTVCTATVSPSFTLISFNTPAAGAGISASTLSVEISNKGSSRSILSPGFLSHLVTVPSKMLSPIWGMTTFTAMFVSCRFVLLKSLSARQTAGGVRDARSVRQKTFLERRRGRHRRIGRGHAHNRAVEIVECRAAHNRRDLAGDAAGACVLMHHQQFIGLAHGIQNCFAIERQKSPQVHDLGFDPFGRQHRGGL